MADAVEGAGQLSRLAQLRQNEQHWIWKAGMRLFLCVIDIVAIGCAAWLVTSAANDELDGYYGYGGFPDISAGSLIVLCIGFLWCLLCLTVPFILRPSRPIHPGVAVGADLIMWLAFIVIGVFNLTTIYNAIYYGSDGIIQDPSWYSSAYSGEYYLAPNNTWIYNITSVYSSGGEYYNYTAGEWEYPKTNTSTIVRNCSPQFTSCAQQDAHVNKLWHEKPTIEGVAIVVSAVEWLGVLFHFILFVWACVDTHRRNARKRVNVDQLVADKILQDLEKRGFIQLRDGVVVAPGAARNNGSPNAAVTEPLLAPTHAAAHESGDAIMPV